MWKPIDTITFQKYTFEAIATELIKDEQKR